MGLRKFNRTNGWLMLSWVGDVASGNVEGLLFLAINAFREFMITVEWVGRRTLWNRSSEAVCCLCKGFGVGLRLLLMRVVIWWSHNYKCLLNFKLGGCVVGWPPM